MANLLFAHFTKKRKNPAEAGSVLLKVECYANQRNQFMNRSISKVGKLVRFLFLKIRLFSLILKTTQRR
ncbi:hypothetical protein CHH78_02530 [Shouchella clausii]|nr:hypothetical protein CHH76_05720 [Shouchella clausii]PAE86193.1 hypothetical protein CHH78_02530 [Shouchella clausii]PAF06875.1 hypothetical protein CHH66_02525 [Shouchella clausii]